MNKISKICITILIACVLILTLLSLEFSINPNPASLSKVLATSNGEIKIEVDVKNIEKTDQYLYALFQSKSNNNASGYGVFQKGIFNNYRFVRASYRSPRKLYSLYDKDVTIVYGIRLGSIATSYSIEYLDGKEIRTSTGTIYDESFIKVHEEKIDVHQIRIFDKDGQDITDMIIDNKVIINDNIVDRIVAESFMIYVYCLFILCCAIVIIISIVFGKSYFKKTWRG